MQAARPSFSNIELPFSYILPSDLAISLRSAIFYLRSLEAICWNIFWYWFMTWVLLFYLYVFQAFWILTIFLVRSYSDSYFVIRMVLIKSDWFLSFWSAKTGTSSCMFLIIRISILLIYSFRFFEWAEELAFLSLVIGWLPPSSEASILIFNSFDTTLSFLMKFEWDWVLFFLGWTAWEMAC